MKFWRKKRMKNGRGRALAAGAAVVAFAALACLWQYRRGRGTEEIAQPAFHLLSAQAAPDGLHVEVAGENLMGKGGVRVTADSQENESFAPWLVRDGIADEPQLRWSSANDWENPEHWLQVDFSEEVQIGSVKIYWERTNACAYALEYSSDAKSWETAASFESPPQEREQQIRLKEPVSARYLRLHVTEVSKEEADLSLYYQNVSVLELEAYGPALDAFVIRTPVVSRGTGRSLTLPRVPEGYTLSFGGADYENLVDAEGRIADTLSPVWAELGFCLEREGVSWELPGLSVCIPASEGEAEVASSESAALPEGVSAMEWRPEGQSLRLGERLCLTLASEDAAWLQETAALFAQELETSLGKAVEVATKQAGDAPEGGEIRLSLADASGNGLGQEGYEIRLGEEAGSAAVEICANTARGIRWGCVTLLKLLEADGGQLPAGVLRDYPRYSVRGFGIDVGRRAISLELLYEIVRELSAHKMNTLQIHLNDNQIIAESGYDGTTEGARGLYAGFRLESEIQNEDGEGITSQDLFYTKEAFAQLIAYGAAYGVDIVPEIDTPAHSLALTKVFPKLGLSGRAESVDQLDLSKEEARQLVKDIWREYLQADEEGRAAVFAGCEALHLGMDEYFGDASAYLSYLQELTGYVAGLAPEKTLRIWGSLSGMGIDYSGVSRQLQLHIWDTSWADPSDMYEAGFSVINSLSSSLYIIPGGGYDYLDLDFLKEEWQPNVFATAERTWELPAWSERMLGACYMMWNDWSWANGDEITQEGLFDRFVQPLPVLAEKLWGETGTGNGSSRLEKG